MLSNLVIERIQRIRSMNLVKSSMNLRKHSMKVREFNHAVDNLCTMRLRYVKSLARSCIEKMLAIS